MANAPIVGEITIKMDSSLSFTHTYRGAPGLLTAMLGALRFSEDWVVEQIKVSHDAKPVPLCTHDESNSLEVEVSRDVAIDLYWKALEKLRQRMIAINESSPDAVFQIDPSLLDTL